MYHARRRNTSRNGRPTTELFPLGCQNQPRRLRFSLCSSVHSVLRFCFVYGRKTFNTEDTEGHREERTRRRPGMLPQEIEISYKWSLL